MKKLNKKGYITIEVLIASIVAAVIAVFLIEITVKLVGRTDDAYVDAVLNTDKALIIKNIKKAIEDDIKKCDGINMVSTGENADYSKKWEFYYNNNECGYSTLFIESKKQEKKDLIQIIYFDNKQEEIYKKEIYNIVNFEFNVNINDTKENFVINIKGDNIFSDKDLNINIPISNRYDEAITPIIKHSVKIRFNNYTIFEDEVNHGDNFTGTTSELNDTFANLADINITCSPVVDVIKTKISNGFTFTIEDIRNNIECNVTQNNNFT